MGIYMDVGLGINSSVGLGMGVSIKAGMFIKVVYRYQAKAQYLNKFI
jgi:hypothetical protein